MAKKPKKKDALAELLEVAPHKVLSKLILRLAVEFPDVRRECFDFLKSQVAVSKALAKRSEGEAILAIWSELAPDLEELDMYGGGDYATQDLVAELLDQIRERLNSHEVDSNHRREILDRVLPFIESGNAGMDDMLYDVAYAACYDDDELQLLAGAFEAMQQEWKTDHARDIYRRIGDREKYLELRTGYMVYEIKVAKKLEKKYPEEILKYYLSGLGNLNRNAQRKEYARKAKVMVKVRHMLVDVIGDKPRWEKFASKVKQDNIRRPAFQQEFADAVPGWSELN